MGWGGGRQPSQLPAHSLNMRPSTQLTKQLFLAMSSVVLMVAADKVCVCGVLLHCPPRTNDAPSPAPLRGPRQANMVSQNYEGALEHSAQAALAGAVVCIVCNLVMLLYFGGELAERLPVFPRARGGKGAAADGGAGQTYNLTAEMVGSSFQPGPAYAGPAYSFQSV